MFGSAVLRTIEPNLPWGGFEIPSVSFSVLDLDINELKKNIPFHYLMDREYLTNSLILIWKVYKTFGELKTGFSLFQKHPGNLFNQIINYLNYNYVMNQESSSSGRET